MLSISSFNTHVWYILLIICWPPSMLEQHEYMYVYFLDVKLIFQRCYVPIRKRCHIEQQHNIFHQNISIHVRVIMHLGPQITVT